MAEASKNWIVDLTTSRSRWITTGTARTRTATISSVIAFLSMRAPKTIQKLLHGNTSFRCCALGLIITLFELLFLSTVDAKSCRKYVDEVWALTPTSQIQEPQKVFELARAGRLCYESEEPINLFHVVWLLHREQSALTTMNRFQEALDAYTYYKEHYAGQGLTTSQANLLINTMHIYANMGHYEKVLPLVLGQDSLIAATPAYIRTVYHINVSATLLRFAFYEKALEQVELGLEFAYEANDTTWIAHATQLMGDSHVKLGNLETGRLLLLRADSLHRYLGRYDHLSSSMTMQGTIYVLQNDPAKGLPFFTEALALAQVEAHARSELYARYRRADVYLKLGRPQLALDDIERALFLADTSGVHEFTHWLHLYDARAKHALNQHLDARQAYFAGMAAFLQHPLLNAETFQSEAALVEASLTHPILSYWYEYWHWLILGFLGLGFLSIAPRLVWRNRRAPEPPTFAPQPPAPLALPIGWQIVGALYIQCFRWDSVPLSLIEQVTGHVRSMNDQGAMMMLASLMVHGSLKEEEDLGKRRMRAWRSTQRLFQLHKSWGALPNKRKLWLLWFQENGWDQNPPEEIKEMLKRL